MDVTGVRCGGGAGGGAAVMISSHADSSRPRGCNSRCDIGQNASSDLRMGGGGLQSRGMIHLLNPEGMTVSELE